MITLLYITCMNHLHTKWKKNKGSGGGMQVLSTLFDEASEILPIQHTPTLNLNTSALSTFIYGFDAQVSVFSRT